MTAPLRIALPKGRMMEAALGLLARDENFDLQILERRLKCAHDEGQADQGEGDHDPRPGEHDLNAERLQPTPHPTVPRKDGGEGDTGYRCRQRKGQVNHGVD